MRQKPKIDDKTLYIVMRPESGEVWEGFHGRGVPKLYTVGPAKIARDKANYRRLITTEKWEAVPVTFQFGQPLKEY